MKWHEDGGYVMGVAISVVFGIPLTILGVAHFLR